jgi:[acyl-carrier-protein] S-malonyltransferase
MRAVLATADVHDPDVALLANADAHLIETADGCRTELVEHLTAGVDWVRAVEAMTAAGVDTFVELGPGKVLTNLIKRIAPDARAIAFDDGDAIDRLTAEPAVSA